jgi:hypothetical protein
VKSYNEGRQDTAAEAETGELRGSLQGYSTRAANSRICEAKGV